MGRKVRMKQFLEGKTRESGRERADAAKSRDITLGASISYLLSVVDFLDR